jgi:hypothetical protein
MVFTLWTRGLCVSACPLAFAHFSFPFPFSQLYASTVAK